MNFSAWSIRNPVPSVVLFVVLCFLGTMSFLGLPVTRFPNIDVPVVAVSVAQSGASPVELETQVTRRVEDAVANLAGVRNVWSTVTDGLSTTTVEFRIEIDVDRALNDVKDAIGKARQDLPRTIEEPLIERIDVEGMAIVRYAASSPAMTLEQLSWHVDDVVRRQVQGLRGVGRVDRIGGVEREVRIDLDPDRLLSLGVTAGEVNRQIRMTAVDLASGRMEVGGQEQTVRTLAGARTLADLENLKIVLSGGREARLSDLATVRDSFVEPRSFARLNGETPIVSFAVYRTKGASDVDVDTVVRARMAQLASQFPNITYARIDDSVSYTSGNYKATMHTLLEGAALAVIVVLVFLRDLRATIITAIALPLSAIPTFFVMEQLGFSLNLVSLLALTLATGILVDDAIVEIENIVRHQHMGKSPYRAAMEAADEIGLAVIAITMTIVAVFAPVSFMGGIAGQYFKQFGLVVAISVLFSLIVARLITPMLAAYFMKAHPAREERDGFVMRAYLWLLRVTVARKIVTLAVGVAFFAVSLWSTTLLPTDFVPAPDAGRFVVSAELPPGSTLEDLRARTDAVARLLRAEVPEIEKVLVVGGASPRGQLEVRRSTVVVNLTHKSQRARTQKQIEAHASVVLAQVPDMRVWLVGERGQRELSLTIGGQDPVELARAAAAIEGAMLRHPSLLNASAAGGVPRPEIRVVPRFEEAARLGVTTDAISEAVRVATIGDVSANLAKFNTGDRLIPVRVQLERAARQQVDLIEALPVPIAGGGQVPLAAVARVDVSQGPSSIERHNRLRRVQLGANLAPGVSLGEALAAIEAMPEVQRLPPGIRIVREGDAEVMGDVFASFATAMVTGILMVLGVLVLLFGSVFHPITILMSLPLSVGGVILALLMTGHAISMPVVIGILMLMGIVTKNAIMLVDFAIEEMKRGVDRVHSVLEAGRKRARPIIMTSIAMIAGMVPSALGFGDGGEFRAPMAIAVIGGLVVSTLLSLVFVPSFFVAIDGLAERVGRFTRRFVGPKEEAVAPGVATAQALNVVALRPLPPKPPLPAAAE